jgi:FkbM family methyltransferase
MLLDLSELVNKYNLDITGVIHVGAHYGEENDVYEKLNIDRRVFFEPVESNYNILEQNLQGRFELHKLALGNENNVISMFVETVNKGSSNSVLEPKLHMDRYPEIVFNEKVLVQMNRLDDLDIDLTKLNFMNIDVQCYELEVFKGAEKTLNKIDFIMSEINRYELYQNCPKVEHLIEFLSPYGFRLVEERWVEELWGDGFFVKDMSV